LAPEDRARVNCMKTNIPIFLLLISVTIAIAEEPRQPVSITGERMEILKRGEITRFLGKVRMVSGKDVVTTDRLEHFEKKNCVIGKGNVHLTAHTEESIRLEANSEQVTYDLKNKKTVLTGNPEVVGINEESPEDKTILEGEVIQLFGNEKRIRVEEGARVEHGEITGTCKFLDYDYETKRIVLSGDSPHIYQDNGEIKSDCSADTITMFINEKRVIMEGNVKAHIYAKNRGP